MKYMRGSNRFALGKLILLSLATLLLVDGRAMARTASGGGTAQATRRDIPQASPHGKSTRGRDNLSRMMRGQRHAPTAPTRNAPAVLAAFRDVVAEPRESAVQVLCGGEQVALGTIVDGDGYVLTKSSEVKLPAVCRLADGSIYPARVISRDVATDLAMLHISAKGLPPITWNDSGSIAPGRWIASVGIRRLPIAIGVVSTRPHRVRGGMLGIYPGEGLRGPLIQSVVRGGGADRAGLMVGDTITHVDGDPVKTPDELIARLVTIPPQQKVRVSILRGDQKIDVTVQLGTGRRANGRQARLQEKLAGPLSDRRVGFAAIFEHDTILEPDQCGGPLVDVDGHAVGINIARATRVSSFALPADVVRGLLPKLMRETTEPVSRKTPDNTLLKPVLPPGSGGHN